MTKTIEDLLKERLIWLPVSANERDFVNDTYPRQECYLRMNDFPEEPLWTLFYKDDIIDFDDAPTQWHITYRSELK